MGKLRSAILFGAVGIFAGWANSHIDNVLLLLLTAWMVALAVLQLEGFVRLSLVQGRSLENRLYLNTGFANPVELFIITLVMALFSFIVYFTVKPHWFLLVHGGWWSMVTLRQLSKLGWQYRPEDPQAKLEVRDDASG